MKFMLIGALPQSLVNFRGPLLEALRAAGCEVHAVAADIEADEAAARWLQQRGVIMHSAPIARAGMNPLGDLRALIRLRAIMRDVRPDAVLGYTIKPVVWGTVAAWLARVPRRYALITGLGYAFTGRAKGRRRLVQRIAMALYRFALRRAHLVFFQNPDDAALFRGLALVPPHLPVRIVNGSGVDLDHYRPAPLSSGGPVFLLIARLLGDKGVREYAAAAAEIRRAYPHAEFHLVGGMDPNPDSIGKDELDAWLAQGDIIWHGPQSDVRPFIARCHVYVLPSYREGTPRTVLEAMAMRRAVITTDAPGCRETVVDGKNGFLVEPRSAGAIARAMQRIIDDPALIDAMGERSLQIVRDRYAADKVASVMLEAMAVPRAL